MVQAIQTDYMQTEITKIMKKILNYSANQVAKNNYPWYAIITDKNFNIISHAASTRKKTLDSTDHAELNAIKKAHKKLKQTKLTDFKIFVNAESCPMCAAAIIRSGITEIYYGAPNESHTDPDIRFKDLIAKSNRKEITLTSGILEDEFEKVILKFKKGKTSFKES